MKKGFKKVCIGVAVASTVTTLVTPSISLAAGNTYKDGIFEGNGGGFYYINTNGTDPRKIKVNVEFENDNIKNVDLIGVTMSNNFKDANKQEVNGYIYPDDLEYLRLKNGHSGTAGAYNIINYIKNAGIDNIDQIIIDLERMYKKIETKPEYDVVSTATASSIGIAKAIKEAAETSKKAKSEADSLINSITFDSLPTGIFRDEKINKEILLRVIEGDTTKFEGLSVRVEYVNGSSKVIPFKDFHKNGLKLVQMKNKETSDIDYGNVVSFNNPSESLIFKVIDTKNNKENFFKVVTKSLEYIPSNLEFRVGNSGFKNIELSKEKDESIFFSDLQVPTYYQNIELNKSDLGREIFLRTTSAQHERNKEKIESYVVSGPVNIPNNLSVNNNLSFKANKTGKIRTINWSLKVVKINDDKEKQLEELKKVIKNVEDDKKLSVELNKDVVAGDYVGIKNELDSAREVSNNYENKSAFEIRNAVESLSDVYNTFKDGKIRHDKETIVKDIKKHLEEAQEKIKSTPEGYLKEQYKDIVENVAKKIEEDKNYELNKEKLNDIDSLSNELNNTFKSPEYIELFNLVDTDAWKLIGNENLEKAKNIHQIRIKLADKLKQFKDKYYKDDNNFYGNSESLIFDKEEKGLVDETKSIMEVVGMREKLDSIKNKTLAAKPVTTEALEVYSQALDFVVKKSNDNKSDSITKPKDSKEEIKVNRISGSDRYDTSIELSKSKFKKADKVYLVSGKNFADAIASSGLTMKIDGPVLLVDDLSADKIMEEIDRLGANDITIIGGKSSVSDKVQEKLSKNSKIKDINRIAGRDRYSTSVKSAEKVLKDFGNKGKVLIVSGTNFADAVSVSSYASKEGLPMLLLDKNGLTKEQMKFIKDNNLNDAIIIGGTSSVKKSVESNFKNVNRIAGANRYETSAMIADKLFKSVDNLFLASGEVFADALAGGYFAADKNAPILLVEKTNVKPMSMNIIKKAKNVTIFGGENSISDTIKNSIVDKK